MCLVGTAYSQQQITPVKPHSCPASIVKNRREIWECLETLLFVLIVILSDKLHLPRVVSYEDARRRRWGQARGEATWPCLCQMSSPWAICADADSTWLKIVHVHVSAHTSRDQFIAGCRTLRVPITGMLGDTCKLGGGLRLLGKLGEKEKKEPFRVIFHGVMDSKVRWIVIPSQWGSATIAKVRITQQTYQNTVYCTCPQNFWFCRSGVRPQRLHV